MAEKSQRNPIFLYRQLHALRVTLKDVDPRLARTSDRLLASIGYPAKALSFYLQAYPLLSRNLGALSDSISDYRTGWRVINTPATIEWALDLLVANPERDPFLRASDYTQAVCGVAYQLLEDLAWLGSKGILPVSVARQNDMWVISCWFWAVHVALELIKAGYFRSKGRPTNFRNLIINLAWAPLTVHWSTYTGVFDNGIVGLLGSAACWPDLIAKW